MEESETVADCFDKVQEHVSAMRACRDTVTDQYIVDKILRTFPPRFDHIVVTIKETRDLENMEVEELQHSLEAHEHRLNERRQYQEQVLQVRFQFHGKGKGSKKFGKKKHKEAQEQQGKDSNDTKNRKSHKSEYNGCEGAKNKPKTEAYLAQDNTSDSKVVMLMARTSGDELEEASWYLDSGCSTHMTGRRDWFVKMKEVLNGKTIFADDRSLIAKESDRIVLRDENGREVVIDEVLFVPRLKTNLLSLGQLLHKGFAMKMENNYLSIFYQSRRMIIKASLSQNRTFRVIMKVVRHQCCNAAGTSTEWL
ncbi:uncharacterized protein LOC108327457 [Vigna angularis]|uniref:uncharacterized protein LOC108327457 n=1 Tax=Phaseolus angularis TaxID=3914 RepID=UPI00080A2341|nr:uncharacterized protein LOC108327457 [Vigna angularis]